MPKLIVDISLLARINFNAGIQRVVRKVIEHWHSQLSATGYELCLVAGNYDSPGYFRLHAMERGLPDLVTLELNTLREPFDLSPLEASTGDIFVGLDLAQAITNVNLSYLQTLRHKGVKVLFVVYDLIPVLHAPYFWPKITEDHHQWLHTTTQFDGIIAISCAVCQEYIQYCQAHQWSLAPGFSVHWFHLGSDLVKTHLGRTLTPEQQSFLQALGQRPTLLTVSTLEPRKGHWAILHALNELWAHHVEVNWVIVGKVGWNCEGFINALHQHPKFGHQLFWLNQVDDYFLQHLYQRSRLLVCANYAEGFGLPLIEAAQHGLPVLARDIPVFREVGANHVDYFSGDRPSNLAQAISDCLQQSEAQARARVKQMPRLDWERSSQSLLDIVLTPATHP